MKIGRFTVAPLDTLLIFVPVAFVLKLTGAPEPWIFVIACCAIIPLAGLMGRATEHLSAHYGPGVSGLLNASFGNAAELIIALMALHRGLHDMVKASITGSIIGNILLVLGLSLMLGGFKHARQTFNKTAAGLGSTLLALSAIGLVIPAVFHSLVKDTPDPPERALSLDIAIVLFVTYLLSLLFSLKTHRHLFSEGGHEPHGPVWSRRKSFTMLVVATAFVALVAELLVGAVEHTAEAWGMSHVFVGVIVVAVIGNAAEHSTAILMAMKNQMDLAINIAVGSSIQVALFIAPLLVFLSYAVGPGPMGLDFTTMEVFGVVGSVIVVALVAHDGESHWMEGVLLLAVYVIFAIAFFFLPDLAH
jgi:Ca2+:H+ antiporter